MCMEGSLSVPRLGPIKKKGDPLMIGLVAFLFTFMLFFGPIVMLTKARSVSGEGVPAQTYTPHVDIAKYDMWAPPDSSYICDRDGNCAWLPDGTILLTPRPETVPPTNYY